MGQEGGQMAIRFRFAGWVTWPKRIWYGQKVRLAQFFSVAGGVSGSLYPSEWA
jgi:hypothetical protein